MPNWEGSGDRVNAMIKLGGSVNLNEIYPMDLSNIEQTGD